MLRLSACELVGGDESVATPAAGLADVGLKQLEFIHLHKTAALLEASVIN